MASSARAEPPLSTDDASILERGKCQIEGQLRRQQRGTEHESSLEFACNLTGRLELAIGRERHLTAGEDPARATRVQAKALVRPLEPDGVGFAVTLGALRQWRTHEPDVSEPSLTLVGSLALLEKRAMLHANLGVRRDRREHLARGTWALAGEYGLLPRLQLVAEAAREHGAKPAVLAGARVSIVPEQAQISLAFGRDRSSSSGRRFAVVGFHVEF